MEGHARGRSPRPRGLGGWRSRRRSRRRARLGASARAGRTGSGHSATRAPPRAGARPTSGSPNPSRTARRPRARTPPRSALAPPLRPTAPPDRARCAKRSDRPSRRRSTGGRRRCSLRARTGSPTPPPRCPGDRGSRSAAARCMARCPARRPRLNRVAPPCRRLGYFERLGVAPSSGSLRWARSTGWLCLPARRGSHLRLCSGEELAASSLAPLGCSLIFASWRFSAAAGRGAPARPPWRRRDRRPGCSSPCRRTAPAPRTAMPIRASCHDELQHLHLCSRFVEPFFAEHPLHLRGSSGSALAGSARGRLRQDGRPAANSSWPFDVRWPIWTRLLRRLRAGARASAFPTPRRCWVAAGELFVLLDFRREARLAPAFVAARGFRKPPPPKPPPMPKPISPTPDEQRQAD